MYFSKPLLYLFNFVSQGWRISLVALLPFLQVQWNLSLMDIGLLSMVLMVAAVLSTLYSGHINNALGSKKLILLVVVMHGLAWAGFLLPPSLPTVYLIFMVSGLASGAFFPVAMALIVRNAPAKIRSQEIGSFTAWGDVARIATIGLTPLLVGFFSLGLTATLYTAVAVAVFLLFALKIRAIPKITLEEGNDAPSKVTFVQIMKSRRYLLSFIAGTFDTFASSSLFIFIPFLMISRGVDIAATGLFTALLFAGYLSGRLVLTRIADKFGNAKIFIFSQLAMAGLVVSLVLAPNLWMMMVNLFLLGVVTRGTGPIIKSLAAEGLEDNQLEKGFALQSSANKTASAVSRPVLSFAGTLVGIGGVFYLSAVISLLTIIPAMMLLKEKR